MTVQSYKIKDIIENYRIKTSVKREKKYRYGYPRMMYKYKELRKYIPDLLMLNKWENELLFDYKGVTSIEIEFSQLMLLRIHDFANGIFPLIGCDCFHSIFPLMRALCESVLLLKYVQIHPEYIEKFMRDEVKKIDIGIIKKEVNDPELAAYYNYLSKMHHSNPKALKLTHYKIDGSENDIIIGIRPHDYLNKYENFVLSITNLYLLGLLAINSIQQKDWKNNSDNN